MWIADGAVRAKVLRASAAEEDWLAGYLSLDNPSKRFDGRDEFRLFEPLTSTFPAGFLPGLRKAAAEAGFAVEVAELGADPRFDVDPAADLAWLYDYQLEAVRRAVSRRRGIVKMVTSSGKTEVMTGIVRSFPRAGWLLLVHRVVLARQAAERFERRNREHGVALGRAGVIGEGEWTEGEALTCASFKSLHDALFPREGAAPSKNRERALALVARTGGVIVDESHVVPADSYLRVVNALKAARLRFGISATPLARGDKKSTLAVGTLGPVIFEQRREELVERKLVARGQVRMVACLQPRSTKATYAGAYRERVVRSKARNELLLEVARRAAKPAFLFVTEIDHGKIVERMLLGAGIRADFVWGAHSTDWRQTAVRALQRGAVEVLVCNVVFQEGLDVPDLRAVINGAGGKSKIAALQRGGRGGRVDRDASGEIREGGDSFELWDVYDVGNRWLEAHALERRNTYLADGYEVVVEREELLAELGKDVPPKRKEIADELSGVVKR